MKLTTRSEYGLLALIYLARQKEGQQVSVDSIAKAQGIPSKFLEQLMLTLKRAGYVRSTRGPKGGYQLSKKASEICIAEVVRLFDGALAPTYSVSRYFYEPTPIEKEKRLVAVFDGITRSYSKVLEATSIASVANP